MNRRVAQFVHSSTNITYWYENPEWQPGPAPFNAALRAYRKIPFSLHEFQKDQLFSSNVIAVNGESVVARIDDETVQKYMFRYPRKMTRDEFKQGVTREVGLVTSYLSAVALPTMVSMVNTEVIRLGSIDAVTQTQPYLSMYENPALSNPDDMERLSIRAKDTAAFQLEAMLKGIDEMYAEHELHPDIANSAGNLRLRPETGDVSLIDVMPIYSNGSRLIGGKPPKLLEHAQENVRRFEDFVGSYGA